MSNFLDKAPEYPLSEDYPVGHYAKTPDGTVVRLAPCSHVRMKPCEPGMTPRQYCPACAAGRDDITEGRWNPPEGVKSAAPAPGMNGEGI